MDLGLEGKSVVITGASRGIGRATALCFAREGANLAICARGRESLDEALKCLEEDHDFLLKGDVFTEDALETWLDYKRENECKQVALRPHPHEFELYYDI